MIHLLLMFVAGIGCGVALSLIGWAWLIARGAGEYPS